ncbi:hypothetical protein EG68_05587 [Paragonimus skrjabini miyazakii]|uniref:Uncharacterized protein n=1 Tax=Paragonimus skrjabini miyazakii TaxID=59628 RepID=A0A8S9YQ90_9TREM|nr:hypothetical protein EG68_05587 [Paragonimus skrjabini miyazakii]
MSHVVIVLVSSHRRCSLNREDRLVQIHPPMSWAFFWFPAIDQERKEKQLLDEITQPPPLKHTETAVKNPLPTKEDIAMEKSAR